MDSRRLRFAVSAAVWAVCLLAGFGAEKGAEVTDGEVWNEGVDFYRAGDVTNALRVLRPLMLSPSHGARAAEVVAKLAYDRAHDAENPEPLAALEEAASAAQIALRRNPAGARENRNFTRAVDGLREMRETKRVNDLLKAAQGQDPGSLLGAAVAEARSLLADAGGYLTNRAEKAVAEADRLAKRAEKLRDAWVPVREAIAASVTNEQSAATICEQIDQAQAKTARAGQQLGDMEGEGYTTLADAEHDFTRFFKLTVLPPQAMGEDLVAQSNAWLGAETVNGRDWQREALDFTRSFRAKFPAWARAYEQQAQADTNRPPFTAEAQAKVSSLATELEKIQLECCEKDLPPEQEKALDIIRQILELLPNDGKGGSSGQQGKPQENDRNSQQQDKDQKDRNQDDGQDQKPNDPELDPNEEPKDDDKKSDPEEGDDERPEDKEVEAILKKAQERSDEHEAEKKARARKFPLPPNERDW